MRVAVDSPDKLHVFFEKMFNERVPQICSPNIQWTGGRLRIDKGDFLGVERTEISSHDYG